MDRSVRFSECGLAITCWFCLAAVFLGPPRAAAQLSSSLTASPDSALAAVLATLPGEPVGLDAVLRDAMQSASQARIASAELDAATGALRREQGVFDPEIFGRADLAGADTPSASLFAGADVLQTETSTLEAGARIRLRLGTEISASIQSLRSVSNSSFAALLPEYQALGSLTIRQPLLKGFGPSARGEWEAALSGTAGAAARLQGARLAVRAEVETTYWNLYASERNHAVSILVRDRAAAFLADTRLRAEAGLVGPSQVASAEYFLAEAEQAALDTSEQMDRTSDRLSSLMGRRPLRGQNRFRPRDEPPEEFELADQESLVALALAHNPDLLAMAQDVLALQARAGAAGWDARPTLDLIGGLGGGGLAGTARDVTFPGSDDILRTEVSGNRGESVAQVFRRDYPTWNLGVVFSLPLGGRQDGGEHDRLRAEVVRAEEQLQEMRLVLEEEIRAQHRELARGKLRLGLATEGVEASIKQVNIGMIEFRNGQSTAFEIVRLAADLANAQQRYSSALVRTASAVAFLRQLTGGQYPQEQENRQ